MGDSIDLLSTIQELKDMQPELRSIGEYRKANILDFAIGYLHEYAQKLRASQPNDEDTDKIG